MNDLTEGGRGQTDGRTDGRTDTQTSGVGAVYQLLFDVAQQSGEQALIGHAPQQVTLREQVLDVGGLRGRRHAHPFLHKLLVVRHDLVRLGEGFGVSATGNNQSSKQPTNQPIKQPTNQSTNQHNSNLHAIEQQSVGPSNAMSDMM